MSYQLGHMSLSAGMDCQEQPYRRPAGLTRREADGTYEEIDWDTAIGEVAAKMAAIRDEHGGDKIFRYGGGGQGNHLGGGYFTSVMAALGIKYKTNALAQEKTGMGWLQNRMFGANVHGDLEHARTLVIVGKIRGNQTAFNVPECCCANLQRIRSVR